MALPPLIRFGTSTWTYEGWQGQVYKKAYANSTFAREGLVAIVTISSRRVMSLRRI